jgi:hypothetical protein
MHLCRAFVVVAVVLGVVGFAGSSADAAVPTLTVQPADQLVDLQVATITGAGFTPGRTIRVAECLASNVTLCNPFTESFPTADATGGFAYTFAVRREIKVTPNSAEITDCGSAPAVCVFSAVNISDLTESASTPFSFDPKVGPLRIDPSVDRKVELTNGGFALSVRGDVQCTLPSTVFISGFILQDSRDPNSGFPFTTFVVCDPPRRSAWSDTVTLNPLERPFLPGKAMVRIEAVAAITGYQVLATEQVVLVAR